MSDTHVIEASQTTHDPADSSDGGVSTSALTRAGGEPVEEFLLIPFGPVGVDRALAGASFTFTASHAASAKRWFDRARRMLAIDYEHQSLSDGAGRADGLSPAAGWIGALEIRDDGLWAANVRWTERARELLLRGEYRYFSPVIYWTDARYSDVAALGPVALTNDPAMRGVQALVARVTPPETLPDECALQRQLAEAQQRVSVLERELRGYAAEAFVQRGMRSGQIIEATREDWRADFLNDAPAAESRLARSPVLLPQGRTASPEASIPSPTALGDPLDLFAYERAAAAGRVRVGGAAR